MIQICFPVFLWYFSETYGYGSANKSIFLYSVRAITEMERIKIMDNVTSNCTSAKADITVKTVFDGKQSGQQAFMKLIQRQYRINGADMRDTDIDKTIYSIDKTQYTDYTKDSEANVGGTTVGFAENGGQHDGF